MYSVTSIINMCAVSLAGREVIEIPTENPLSEGEAWHYARDVVLGLEYRTLSASLPLVTANAPPAKVHTTHLLLFARSPRESNVKSRM